MTTEGPNPENSPSARELIHALCDGVISPEQLETLDRLVITDVEVRRLYIRMMQLHAGLYQHAPMVASLTESECDCCPAMDDTMVLPSLAELQKYEEQEQEQQEVELPEPALLRKPNPSRSIAWRAGLAAAIALVIGAAALISLNKSAPPPQILQNTALRTLVHPEEKEISPSTEPVKPLGPSVATIINAVDAEWGGDTTGDLNSGMPAGASVELKIGCAELVFTGGAHVVIQGPAQFVITSGSAVRLMSGKLVANVPGGGFVVNTPTASVKDLGTEFGVGVEGDGQTQVDVFKGKVQAAPMTAGTSSPPPEQLLSEGQAAQVSTSAVAMDRNGASPQRFVRSLNGDAMELDLVDVICGGDGSTHRRGSGINTCTGHAGVLPQIGSQLGDHRYHAVPELPAIDGCCIPDGSLGPVQVDSAGHTFPFPPTANHTTFLLWAGGPVPQLPWTPGAISTRLGDVDYGTDGHGLLFAHCNKLLTLNLDVLRQLHPGQSLARFHCITGNSTPGKFSTLTDAQVLIDGIARFKKMAFTTKEGAMDVDLPLTDSNHFLTLASTDGGDNTGHDWVIWADPIIETTGKKAAPAQP